MTTMTPNTTSTNPTKSGDLQHALWRSKVDGWKSELKIAEAKAEKGSAELRAKFAGVADDLRHRAKKLELKIEQMNSGLGHDVSRIIDEVERGWKELREDFRKKTNDLMSS